jgi:thiol-disulfide isomerase/thioredoxin
MKYSMLSIFAALFFTCNPAATQSEDTPTESPDIAIQVEGLGSGPAYLIATRADQRYRLDSTSVDDAGRMVFKRDAPYPAGLIYVYLPDKSNLQMLVDKDQAFSMKTRTGDLVGSMKVEGSLDNELLYNNLRFEAEMQPKIQESAQKLRAVPAGSPEYDQLKKEQDQLVVQRKTHLDEIFNKHPNSFFTKFKSAGQNPDVKDVRKPDGSVDQAYQAYLYRSEFWNNVDFSDDRLLATPVIANKLKRYMTELTPQVADSINSAASFLIDKVLDRPEYYKFFANWIALNYEPTKTTVMDPQAVYVHMIQNYFTYDRAFWSDSVGVYALQLRAHEMAASLVGKKGPDVRAQGPDGKFYSISEIKSPYVIVYMFNPTCEHCMIETPKLVRLYQEWKAKGMEVFAIALDTNDAEWKAYIAKNGMNWINVFDPTNKAIYAKYFVDITPEIYVLNPDRTIIGKNLKVDQIVTVIERDMRK